MEIKKCTAGETVNEGNADNNSPGQAHDGDA